MNYIASCYLTTTPDHQRGIMTPNNDVNYILNWYNSVVRLGLKGIIFHDDLSSNFIANFPKMKFIKVSSSGNLQLSKYRWLIYFDFLKKNNVKNIFFTDVMDCVVIKDPFIQKEYNNHSFFCGDEDKPFDKWFIEAASAPIRNLPYFEEVLKSNQEKKLLNCGIVGGSWAIMITFLNLMFKTIDLIKHREDQVVGDMPIFNYVAHKYFTDIIHGFPVNSVFNNFETRNDVWFIHK